MIGPFAPIGVPSLAGRCRVAAGLGHVAAGPGRAFPAARMHLVTATPDRVAAIGGSELVFADGVARNAPVVSLIIITIGASIFIQGVAQIVFGKGIHRLPSFSGDDPIRFGGATILPQSLWVIGGALLVFVGLWLFFTRTLTGRAVLATSNNRLAAQLVGINTNFMMTLSFGISAAVGALAGLLISPITLTSYQVGVPLALKGFAAAILGGMGSPRGALAGGVLLGLLEALTAGYLSSHYKDAVAFIVILVLLSVKPQGLFGLKTINRV